MRILSPFPSNLFLINIEEDTDELLKEESHVDSYKYETEHGFQNTYKNRVLEQYPKTKDILFKQWLIVAHDVLKMPCDYIITTSWMTKVNKGDESQTHYHKHSFYSGVYYYDHYDESSASIEFLNPIIDKFDFAPEPTEYNLQNSKGMCIRPERKLLILFPSYLEHHIKINNSDTPRKSLAFNIIPIGKYGVGDSYIDTSWFNVNKDTNT